MASSGIIHAKFLPVQDIRYWCGEGLIGADGSLMLSQSRRGCRRNEGGKWGRENKDPVLIDTEGN